MCEILSIFLETGQHWVFKDEYVQAVDFGDRDEDEIVFLTNKVLSLEARRTYHVEVFHEKF